jgi:nitrogenase molybdenum-iron protein alpha/beta subunit
MIARCFHDIQSDGLTGAIAAIEGIRDAAVLLNGPTGCKFYHAAVCEDRLPRADSLDPLRHAEPFYFGQPRVPATYLDGHDYVFGATEKLERILRRIAQDKGHGLIAVVNAPGAALIGDDLEGFLARAALPVPCVAVENPGFSTAFADGYHQAAVKAVAALTDADHAPQPCRLNLIGTSLMARFWEGDTAELKRLLALCGIRTHAVLMAGVTTRQIRTLARAALNVALDDHLGEPLGRHLHVHLDTPVLIPSAGAPVGFDATEQFLKEVCAALQVSPRPALEAVACARGRAYGALSRFHTLTGLPKGADFALQAPPATALPLTRWLYHYLGMIPAAVYTDPGPSIYREALAAFLADIGCGAALDPEEIPEMPRVVLAGGAVLARLSALQPGMAGIEIALPGSGRIDVLPRAIMGARGALYLIEAILNALNR